jgi:hypothetical protein
MVWVSRCQSYRCNASGTTRARISKPAMLNLDGVKVYAWSSQPAPGLREPRTRLMGPFDCAPRLWTRTGRCSTSLLRIFEGLPKTCVNYGHGESCKVGERLQRHPLFKHTQGFKQKSKRRFPAKRMLVTALNSTLAQLLSQASIHCQHLTTAPNPARVSAVCSFDPSWDAISGSLDLFRTSPGRLMGP